MKKKALKNLKLEKQIVSQLDKTNIVGGNSTMISNYNGMCQSTDGNPTCGDTINIYREIGITI